MKKVLLVCSVLCGVSTLAGNFSKTYDGYCVGPVKLDCGDAGEWTFSVTRGVAADGVEEMEIALSAPKPSTPPKFSVSFDFPQIDAHHK